jgi:NAD-dependent deacetylase
MVGIQFSPRLVEAIRHAQRLVVFSGAGISAESGVPTFRDALQGLWARYDPQQLASPAAFRRDPALVWSWYAWRRALVEGVAPNPGHTALASMARRLPGLTIITQNVDGLHQQAGSSDVIELHGSLVRYRCARCGQAAQVAQPGKMPPACTACGGLIRPGVVWFGEPLPAQALERALAATVEADVFLSIGTSTQVYPAAVLPFEAARAGALTVEINPRSTPFTPHADEVIATPAGVALPALLAAAWPDAG